MKLTIGLVGEILAGKGTTARFIADLAQVAGFTVCRPRFSDLLRQVFGIFPIPETRHNLQLLPQLLRTANWEGMSQREKEAVLSNAMKNMIQKRTEDMIILDGVRWWSDVEMLRGLKPNLLIYITASPETRFGRLKRNENLGEAQMTWEEFLAANKAESEISIPEIGRTADATIRNDFNTFPELIQEVRKILTTKIYPLLG